MENQTQQKFETWAIVELFGHSQIAGLVTEATIGGCSFVRVDVPEMNGRSAFTKFYGNGAIYSMTPVGEEEARIALANIMPRPVSTFLLPTAKPGAPAGTIEEGVSSPEDYDDDISDGDEDDDERRDRRYTQSKVLPLSPASDSPF